MKTLIIIFFMTIASLGNCSHSDSKFPEESFEQIKNRAKTQTFITVVDFCNSDFWIESTNYLNNHNFYPIGNTTTTPDGKCVQSFEKGPEE